MLIYITSAFLYNNKHATSPATQAAINYKETSQIFFLIYEWVFSLRATRSGEAPPELIYSTGWV